MTNSTVQRFSHLVKLKHADKAKAMLEKVASLVKPLMRKHSWTLPLLSEMLPNNPTLLGLNCNAGQKILLRLRPHHAPDTFLDLDDVIGTMLHELAHNVHGPHDAKFYAFLAKLNDEYDTIAASGWRGDGFHSDGIRIGVGTSHDLPMHLAKEKAIKAAEERIRVQKLMSGGGRLGGGGAVSRAGKSKSELAAEAAERRLRDDKMCGVDQAEEAAKANQDGVIEINDDDDERPQKGAGRSQPLSETCGEGKAPAPDFDSDDEIQIIEAPPRPSMSSSPTSSSTHRASPTTARMPRAPSIRSAPNPALRPRPTAPAKALGSSANGARPPSSSAPPPALESPPAPADVWSCPACTFHNALALVSCDVCSGARPVLTGAQKAHLAARGWTCAVCGQTGIGSEWWCCVTAGCSGVRGWS